MIVFLVSFFLNNLYPCDIIGHINTKEKVIYITYDDGPSAITSEIVDLLNKYNVKATFFVLGENLKKYPDALKKINNSGHIIGNHTYHHINFYKENKKKDIKDLIEKEIKTTEDEIVRIIDKKPFLLRYPYGYSKKNACEIAKNMGYRLYNWSFGYDWHKISDDELLRKYIENIYPGAILLMHDTPKNNKRVLKITDKIIEEALKKGYSFNILK